MRSLLPVFLLLLASGMVFSGNWPHWRGPSRDGVSLENNLPVKWNQTENIRWKLAMPAWSGSTPIIWGDKIFLNVAEGGSRVMQQRGRRGARPAPGGGPDLPANPEAAPETAGETSDQLSLWCVDRNNGKILWKRQVAGGNKQMRKQNMSSPSPVTDGQHVWVLTGTGILKGFDFVGNEIWTRDIQADYGPFGLNWGYASSPLLFEETIYVQVLHGMKTDDPSYILAIDKKTGRNRWRVERPTDALMESPDAYTTPALLQYDGRTEIVVSGGDYVTGHDPETGRELWRAGGLNPEKRRAYRIVASPIVRDNMIYVPSRQDPLLAFKAGGRGDVTVTHRVWSTPDGPDVPTPVTNGKYLYIVGDQGVMSCLDAKTGQEIWGKQRVRPGIYSASPVLADGKIYVTSEEGVTTVLAAGPEFKVLAENDLASYTLSSPAISNGQIFIRTESHLYCIGK